jgi:hypothetical protein
LGSTSSRLSLLFLLLDILVASLLACIHAFFFEVFQHFVVIVFGAFVDLAGEYFGEFL